MSQRPCKALVEKLKGKIKVLENRVDVLLEENETLRETLADERNAAVEAVRRQSRAMWGTQ